MRLSTLKHSSVVVLLVTSGFSASHVGAEQTRASQETVIDGPRIRLGDLVRGADIEADLGPAAIPGHVRRVSRLQVEQVLGGHLHSKHRLPRYWTVRTRKQMLSCVRLTRLLRQALTEHLSGGLNLEQVGCRAPVTLPAGKVELVAKLGQAGRRAGRLSAQVTLLVGNWPAQHLSLPIVIDGDVAVVVAQRNLRPGQILRDADVRVEQRRASIVPADVVSSPQELSGQQLTRFVSQGMPIRSSALKPQPVVYKGSVVTVAVKLPGIRVTSRGTVREDAGLGDVVTVLCQSSHKLIRGRVVSPRLVQVDM